MTDTFRIRTDEGFRDMLLRTSRVSPDDSYAMSMYDAPGAPATDTEITVLRGSGSDWLSRKMNSHGGAVYQEGRRAESSVPSVVDKYTRTNRLLDAVGQARWALIDENHPVVDVAALEGLVASHVVTVTGQLDVLGLQTTCYETAMDPETGFAQHQACLTPTGIKLSAERTSPAGEVIWQWVPSAVSGPSSCLPNVDQLSLLAGVQTDYVAVQRFAPPDGMPAPVPEAGHLLYSDVELPDGFQLVTSAFITATMSVVDRNAVPGWMVAQEASGEQAQSVILLQGAASAGLPLPQLKRLWPPSWDGSLLNVPGDLYKDPLAGEFADGTPYHVLLASDADEVPAEIEPLDFEAILEWVEDGDVQVVMLGYGVTASELVVLGEAYHAGGG